MKHSMAYLIVLVLSVPACSSDSNPPSTDAAGASDATLTAVDAAPIGPRNAKAVGSWTVETSAVGCDPGFSGGFVATALANDDQFLLVFKDKLPNGATVQTTCTFSTDTAFTCSNVSISVMLGTCAVSGGIASIGGTITGTSFEIEGDFSSYASVQCPGGQQSCGPAVSTATGTIAP